MSNYDNDVLGVGNFEHPANKQETYGMSFQEAMESLTPEQRLAIEEEFIDRNSQVDRYANKLAKAKELMQSIVDADQAMFTLTVGDFGAKYFNNSEWNKIYVDKVLKKEELKKLLLGL